MLVPDERRVTARRGPATVPGPLAVALATALTTPLIAPPATADEAVLIGGGHDPHGSPGRIELNVRWVRQILDEHGVTSVTFFTDGDAPGPDVHHDEPAEVPDGPLAPLSNVFGEPRGDRRRYREHALADIAGGTRRDTLEPALIELFERTADEPLLLVYDGHGSRSSTGPEGVALDLWDRTSLSAAELHGLLGAHRSPARVVSTDPTGGPSGDLPDDPFRFVFTQCHSGGFHRLAYADPGDGLALAATPRCGFTAGPAHAPAGGCGAGIDDGDHRDYTTHFFAALADRERDNSVLDRDPDIDASGDVTLREAHLHALEKAWSDDLPRSTSEDFLERWQPWWLRWLPVSPGLPNNEYARLYRTLAARHALPPGERIGRRLRSLLADHEARAATVTDERAVLRGEIGAVRERLREAAASRWPALSEPYTGAYAALATSGELERAAAWIAGEPAYATLLALLRRGTGLEAAQLDAERDVTQVRKLLRLRRLATLKGQLETHGGTIDRERYAALLACEELPLTVESARSIDAAASIDD